MSAFKRVLFMQYTVLTFCFPDGNSYDSSSSAGVSASTPNSEDSMTPDSVTSLVDVDNYDSTEQAARVLIEFIVTR